VFSWLVRCVDVIGYSWSNSISSIDCLYLLMSAGASKGTNNISRQFYILPFTKARSNTSFRPRSIRQRGVNSLGRHSAACPHPRLEQYQGE
jgi:hypothetical protein